MFISFCVVNYNNEKYIRECLDSVLSQTDDDYEVIVVDDGSTDQSGAICDEYAMKRPDKISAFHQKQQGVSVARNHAISKANGEWIFFIDGDDVISPYSVELLRKIDLSAYNLVQYGYKTFKDGQKYDQWDNAIAGTEIQDNIYILKRAIYPTNEEQSKKYRFPTIWGKLFRRSYLDETGCRFIPGVVFSQDMIFCLKAFDREGSVVLADTCLYGYRLNNSAIASRYSPKLHDDVELVKSSFLSAVNSLSRKGDIDQFDKRVSLRLFAFVNKVIKCDILHQDNKRPISEKKANFEKLLDAETFRCISELKRDDVDNTERPVLKCVKDKSFNSLRFYVSGVRLMQKAKRKIDVLLHKKSGK